MPPKKSTASAAKKEEAPATKKSSAKGKTESTAALAKGASMKAAKDDAVTATATATAVGGSAADNAPLIKAFEELMHYEAKVNAWASKAYKKVVGILVAHKTKINSADDVKGKEGVGKASVDKINEFLTTGTIKKLEEYREEFGELATPYTSVASKAGTSAKLTPKPPAAAVLKKIKAANEKFMQMTAENLKALLRTNRQSTTGTKDELAQRCAEGLILGAIPPCPLCYAGKPKYNIKTGIYSCPGYMDDDEFKACFFESNDMARNPWDNV